MANTKEIVRSSRDALIDIKRENMKHLSECGFVVESSAAPSAKKYCGRCKINQLNTY
jgi:hypothetical protein